MAGDQLNSIVAIWPLMPITYRLHAHVQPPFFSSPLLSLHEAYPHPQKLEVCSDVIEDWTHKDKDQSHKDLTYEDLK